MYVTHTRVRAHGMTMSRTTRRRARRRERNVGKITGCRNVRSEVAKDKRWSGRWSHALVVHRNTSSSSRVRRTIAIPWNVDQLTNHMCRGNDTSRTAAGALDWLSLVAFGRSRYRDDFSYAVATGMKSEPPRRARKRFRRRGG